MHVEVCGTAIYGANITRKELRRASARRASAKDSARRPVAHGTAKGNRLDCFCADRRRIGRISLRRKSGVCANRVEVAASRHL